MSQIIRYHLINQISLKCRSLSTSSLLLDLEKLNIPVRINRGTTDILKALAGTVKEDTTGPLYKYHDDPYLIPTSNYEKKSYALSKESGKKAARWILQNHAELFNHQPDDPVIKEFLPKFPVTIDSDVSEEMLRDSIRNIQVSDAINIFNICQSKNLEISIDTRQALLELISYYNCDDAADHDWLEEAKMQFVIKSNRSVKTWKEKGLAEELFATLKEENGAKPYCAIIKGMCMYNQAARAWQLYQESVEKNLILDSETFNAIIGIAPILKDENQLRWKLIEELTQKMVEVKVPPNLGTLNNILQALTVLRSWVKASTLSLQVLSEFKRCNIEPSLGSYFYLLKIHYARSSSISNLLPSILDTLEGRCFTLLDLKDTWFFFTAMEICQRDIQSWETAERVHNLLVTGDNYKFLGENFKELIYYRSYMILAVNSLPIEDFMQIYDSLVSNVYSPSREVMEEILKAIGVYDKLDLLPRIWSDIILVELSTNDRIIEMTLMIVNTSDLEKIDPVLSLGMVNIAWDIWTRVQTQSENTRQKVEWSGQMLGDCASVLARCGDLKKSGQILKELENNPTIVLGILPLENIKQIFDIALKEENFDICMMLIKYGKENDYPEAIEMAKCMEESSQIPIEIKKKLIY